MNIESKEHHDLMLAFEKFNGRYSPERENKSMWSQGAIYCNGETNYKFIMFRAGYALGKTVETEANESKRITELEAKHAETLEQFKSLCDWSSKVMELIGTICRTDGIDDFMHCTKCRRYTPTDVKSADKHCIHCGENPFPF